MMLHTERATRGSQRAFVRYGDLLRDWTIPVFGLGKSFDLWALQEATANDVRAVHSFIDPNLRRVQLTWDDIAVPRRLQDLAEETWQVLNTLAEPEGDTPAAQETLDQLRAAYGEMYDEAEALSSSTALAARREGAASAKAQAPEANESDAAGGKMRAMVPEGAKRSIRKVRGK